MSERAMRCRRSMYRWLLPLALLVCAPAVDARAQATPRALDTLVIQFAPGHFDLVFDWFHQPFTFVDDSPDWTVSATLTLVSGTGLSRIWHQEAFAQHDTPLHPGETGPGEPLISIASFPDFGSFSFVIDRPHGRHVDRYTEVVTDIVPGERTRVEIHGLHLIPEPATVTLVVAGLGVVFGHRRWGRKRRRAAAGRG
jgi:hypothetical protein